MPLHPTPYTLHPTLSPTIMNEFYTLATEYRTAIIAVCALLVALAAFAITATK